MTHFLLCDFTSLQSNQEAKRLGGDLSWSYRNGAFNMFTIGKLSIQVLEHSFKHYSHGDGEENSPTIDHKCQYYFKVSDKRFENGCAILKG
jgi:hypothetical protein